MSSSSDETSEVIFNDPKKDTIYCGKKEELPFGYERKGESYECFKTGIGVGMIKSQDPNKREKEEKNVRVLSNLEVLRLANRLGIRTFNDEGRPYSRIMMLESINKRMGEMYTFFEEDEE